MNHEERCRRIVHNIDTLSQTELEELFRMIHRNNYNYTKNNHGVFINLSWIPDEMVTLMENYIEFCHRSKVELQKYESICDVLTSRMHEEREKEAGASLPFHRVVTNTSVLNHAKTQDANVEKGNAKISTSLRFYLLKKKFAKVMSLPNNYENDLKPEEYVLSN